MNKLINGISFPFKLIGGLSHKSFSGRKNKPLWQSAFGWSVSIAWFMVMSTICWAVISGNPDASEIIMAMVETSPLWGVALGVLGIAFVKSDISPSSARPRKQTKK